MPRRVLPADPLLEVWKTNARVTAFLIENLPSELWPLQVPGAPRRTLGMIAGHIHNARCRWIKALGAGHGVGAPKLVDRRKVGRGELLRALERSSQAMLRLLELCRRLGDRVPQIAWLNFPGDIAHFVAYFVAHEAHHRGQLILLARSLGRRLPDGVTNGLWQWTKLSRGSL